jgi:hypothetical protein
VAPRAYWKGYLKLSLVSCPVALFPASSEREKITSCGRLRCRPSSTNECPRAPAAEPGTPGPTINRSGTQNDQWQPTVYVYGARCSRGRAVAARSMAFTEFPR